MYLIEIPEKQIKKYLPEDLSECDGRQYIEMCALIFGFQTEQITYDEFRIHALYKLLDMKPVKRGQTDVEKHSKIYQLSELLDSFFDIEDDKKVIKQYYNQNPLPKFLSGIHDYIGPKNEEDFTFGAYLDTLEAFVDFNQTGDTVFLLKMLAINYRKKSIFKHINQRRRENYTFQLESRIDQFKTNHIGIIYGFYLFFASVHKYISTAKIFVHGNEIDMTVLFDSPTKKTVESNLPGLGMKSVLYSLAESGIYGNIDSVRNTPLWEVLIRMYDVTKRNEDEKAQLKKQGL